MIYTVYHSLHHLVQVQLDRTTLFYHRSILLLPFLHLDPLQKRNLHQRSLSRLQLRQSLDQRFFHLPSVLTQNTLKLLNVILRLPEKKEGRFAVISFPSGFGCQQFLHPHFILFS